MTEAQETPDELELQAAQDGLTAEERNRLRVRAAELREAIPRRARPTFGMKITKLS